MLPHWSAEKVVNPEIVREEMVNVISRAFDRDPVFNWIVKQDHRREERIRHIIETSLKIVLPFAEVYTTKEKKGFALWVPPYHHRPSAAQTFNLMKMFVQTSGPRRLMEMLHLFRSLQNQYPEEPFCHLLYLAVDPEDQGKGMGTSLLLPVLAECSTNNILAYLENSNENNLSLYQKSGFCSFNEWQLPKNGPTIWFMKRDPS
jgi:hypothetical protein